MLKSFYQYVDLSGMIFKWNKRLGGYINQKFTNSELKDIILELVLIKYQSKKLAVLNFNYKRKFSLSQDQLS